jgi:hypothetical protein
MRNLHWFATFLCAASICSVARAAEQPTTAPVVIEIDASKVVQKISPFVYGMNFCDWKRLPHLTITRQGGNRMTAWNWETNASNAGNDWHHQNDDYLGGGETPGEVARALVASAFERGKSVIVTVPMAGYVSADKKSDGDVGQTPDYLATRFIKSYPKKSAPFTYPPNTKDNAVYQDEFVWWLATQQFPREKRNDGELYFALDNEPDLWANTHARIHPQKVTYAELVERTRDYAGAIKDVIPDATIFGFVSYGYAGYMHLQDAPDAANRDFIEFFLDSMRTIEQQQNRRLVDVLDLHWYPEARGAGENGKRITEQDVDPATAEARVQAPRSLWDSTYTENSWITNHVLHEPIRLIPRIKEKIDRHYPGTKLAFAEYDFGGVNHISGAIAQADVLGIFGEQGVFASTYWGNGGEYLFAAFDCYRNFDGRGGHFGDLALAASSSDVQAVSVHASKFGDDPNKLALVLINRSDRPQRAQLKLASFKPSRAKLYRLTADAPRVKAAPDAPGGPVDTLTLPPMSVTTAVLEK